MKRIHLGRKRLTLTMGQFGTCVYSTPKCFSVVDGHYGIKPQARNFIWGSHLGDGAQVLGATIHCFPKYILTGNWVERGRARTGTRTLRRGMPVLQAVANMLYHSANASPHLKKKEGREEGGERGREEGGRKGEKKKRKEKETRTMKTKTNNSEWFHASG